MKTVTEKYRAVNEGKMAKKEFVRQMRQSYPMYVSQYDSFNSTVQILKNKGMLFEAKVKAAAKPKQYDDKPALTYSLDALERGIRVELAAGGNNLPSQGVKPEEYLNAEKKAKANLEKNANHYLDLMSGESDKVDKHDKEVEVKRGAKDTDVFNGLKKAELKESVNEDEEEDAKNDLDSYDHDFPHQDESMSEDAKKALLGKVVGALRTNYPDITAGILKDFIKTHYQDLLDGADIEDEFREYISVNYEGPSDMGEKYDREDGDGHVGTNTDDDFEREQQAQLAQREAKGTDHDGDGDIDGDDYMAAKDKAIKKAMGKDPKEEQLKEAIKSIIKKTLTVETINEAATAKLADWGAGYESFEGVKSVVNELENIVTEVEQFYDKINDKIAKTFAKTADFRNQEGLKIGAFIAPSLETAFNQDLRPVIRKGFTKKVELPKVKTISQADVDAHNSGERPVDELETETKDTIFSSPSVNGAFR